MGVKHAKGNFPFFPQECTSQMYHPSCVTLPATKMTFPVRPRLVGRPTHIYMYSFCLLKDCIYIYIHIYTYIYVYTYVHTYTFGFEVYSLTLESLK